MNGEDVVEFNGQKKKIGLATVLSISALGISLILGSAFAFVLVNPSVAGLQPVSDEGLSAETSTETIDPQANEQDLYSPPADLSALIAKVQESTVTIRCKKSEGSGWVIDLGSPSEDADEIYLEIDREFPYEVITNFHVIEDCIDTPKRVRARAGEEEFDAHLYSWDEENDLAIVSISQNVPALEPSSAPQPGWWAMAIGTPHGLEGSISIGNVMNIEGGDVITTTPFNSGNSGGPLVNSRGEVLGTNTWSFVEDYAQNWNVAVGIPALCDEVVRCDDDDEWLWN